MILSKNKGEKDTKNITHVQKPRDKTIDDKFMYIP